MRQSSIREYKPFMSEEAPRCLFTPFRNSTRKHCLQSFRCLDFAPVGLSTCEPPPPCYRSRIRGLRHRPCRTRCPPWLQLDLLIHLLRWPRTPPASVKPISTPLARAEYSIPRYARRHGSRAAPSPPAAAEVGSDASSVPPVTFSGGPTHATQVLKCGSSSICGLSAAVYRRIRADLVISGVFVAFSVSKCRGRCKKHSHTASGIECAI